MKKWKLIILTAVLSMMVGTQVFAEELPEQDEVVNVEEESQNEEPGSGGGTSISINLPFYESSNDWIGFGVSTAVCEDGNIDLARDVLRSNYTLSQENISMEEAQKIFGSGEVYKVGSIDFKPAIGNLNYASSLDGKTVKEIIIQGELWVETRDEFISNDVVKSGDVARANKEVKILYFPAGGASYKECTITYVDIDGRLRIEGLQGTVLPVAGARFVFISGTTASDSSTTSGSSSSPSSSGTPEVYSKGASVGEVSVKKSGVAAKVIKTNGEEIQTIVHPYITPGTKSLTQAQAQTLLGTGFVCSIYSFDLSIVDAAGDYSQVTLKEGAVPVTFLVPGVTPESRVALRHWINGGSTYEDLPVEIGNGTVTATFTSFSPVVIVVEQPGVTAAASTPTSPKTGENSVLYLAEIVALLSLLGLSVCWKKRQI